MNNPKQAWLHKAFSSSDPNTVELFKAILVVIDEGLQIEMSRVMAASTTGEARTHSAGRMDAFNDMLVHLQDRRDAGLKSNSAQTDPAQQPNLRPGS
jgi:hypothetical protein